MCTKDVNGYDYFTFSSLGSPIYARVLDFAIIFAMLYIGGEEVIINFMKKTTKSIILAIAVIILAILSVVSENLFNFGVINYNVSPYWKIATLICVCHPLQLAMKNFGRMLVASYQGFV